MCCFVPFCTFTVPQIQICTSFVPLGCSSEILQHIATYSYRQPLTAIFYFMSSNIRITRICQFCGNEFTAQTTRTRYCSHKCNSKHYKALQKGQKIEASNQETREVLSKQMEELKAKEFLSIDDTCSLLGVSRWTVWRGIKRNDINAVKIGRRTLIKRSEIDKLFA